MNLLMMSFLGSFHDQCNVPSVVVILIPRHTLAKSLIPRVPSNPPKLQIAVHDMEDFF